ncbi:prolyl oligopeptidase family serine peptidase [Flavobacterium sp. MAH-1]|uniref:Prolyl oligopeptidase family serine peptidase n=1 Tax=Flavobacterium agri TaxID=2743471 RepID=A0A7Y9C653_9FLAO|nr:prolyl oligopeptidase family serine peptidase [Flavobacterium agri]NUY79998.1 prolyl oligopeptidase family serine peptidase [Flavobacterium agri]NYA70023.1 prolyl oligopeptidase family serine peptidase [Flavobacterium agri]
MKKSLLALCFLFALSVFAQQTSEKFVLETKYLLYLPDGYDSDKNRNWPLMIFLHGSGESGDDLNKVKVNGPPKLIDQGKKFPMIVVSPQAPQAEGFKPDIIRKMLNDLKSKYRIDTDRIYLTGLSMGGYGTWKIAQEFPEEFAAIAPVCGGGDPSMNYRLRHIPVWCFHGAKDDVVLPSESQVMIDSLEKYSKDVKFTLYPEANHNSWDATYSNDSVYDWMLSQTKFKFKRVALPVSDLQKYVGTYTTTSGSQDITILVENDKLMIYGGNNPNEKIEFIPASETTFYLFEGSSVEFRFTPDKKGRFNTFLFYDSDKIRNYKRQKSDKKN